MNILVQEALRDELSYYVWGEEIWTSSRSGTGEEEVQDRSYVLHDISKISKNIETW